MFSILAIGVCGRDLNGCWNDVKTFKRLMINAGLAKRPGDIIALLDRPEAESQYRPTLDNINARTHYTHKVIYLSGHGSGQHRALCLTDGYLPFVSLHNHHPRLVIFDCCHSGNAMLLQWSYNRETCAWCPNTNYVETTQPLITLSSCSESEQSSDIRPYKGKAGGVFTQCLFRATRGGKDFLRFTIADLAKHAVINSSIELDTDTTMGMYVS